MALRHVFAHFMVGNTYPYTIGDWLADIELASGKNIDGFALNVGRDDWQLERVADCLEAASQTIVPFSFFICFDMSSISGNLPEDAEFLYAYIHRFGLHPRMFRYDRGVVVSTFAGECSFFGQPSLDEGWTYLKSRLESITPIHFMPSFFIDVVRYAEISCMDGAFNWNGSWPMHLNNRSSRREIEHPKLDTDQHHIRCLGGRTFMAAVSPWFFTHYGPDTWNKNWIYRCDNWHFIRRWEQLIEMRNRIDIAQVISWNDYGESHYIGPIKGAQPNSQSWVDGFPHDAWLELNSYYSRAFKEGTYPSVEKDQIFMWARPHPRDVQSPDTVPRPTHWELTDDECWVVVFSIAPAKVSLYAGEGNKKSFEVNPGITKLSRSLKVGRGMAAKMKRKGTVVAECRPLDYLFEENPKTYNFNAFTTKSS